MDLVEGGGPVVQRGGVVETRAQHSFLTQVDFPAFGVDGVLALGPIELGVGETAVGLGGGGALGVGDTAVGSTVVSQEGCHTVNHNI